jgi:hypothetical protein
MGQEVHVVCPVAGTQTLERSAGKAATTVAVPVDRPAAQLLHATVGSVLFVAMAHAVHVVAPVTASVLVMDPAGQAVQLAAVQEAVQIGVGEGAGVPPAEGVRRYLPAAQATHEDAPVLEPVLVMDPAAQVVQLSAVHAAGEPVQIGVGVEGVPPAEGVPRYLPAAQALQEEAPALEPLSVMDPAGQGVQAVLPTVGEGEAATYVPGGHEEQAVAPGVGHDTGGEYCPPEVQ